MRVSLQADVDARDEDAHDDKVVEIVGDYDFVHAFRDAAEFLRRRILVKVLVAILRKRARTEARAGVIGEM